MGTGMTNNVYNCEEAETEIVSLEQDLLANVVVTVIHIQIKLMSMLI